MSSSDSPSPVSSMTSSPREAHENLPKSPSLKREVSDSDEAVTAEKTPKLKATSMGFSIQSILARPEPIRPVPEHAFTYPHHLLHYSSLAAFFPQKLLAQSSGHMPPLYGSCWQPQISRNDSPENLSTKPFSSTVRSSVKPEPPGTTAASAAASTNHPSTDSHGKRDDKDAALHTSPVPSSKSVHAVNSVLAARKLISSSMHMAQHQQQAAAGESFNVVNQPDDNNSRSPSPFSTDGGNDDRDGKSRASSPTGSSSHRRKKTRTVFSRSQVFQLESTFDLKRYLSSADRAALAASLNLSEQQIKIWFQNRRNKWKRQISSDTDSALISAGQMHAAATAGRFGPGHPAFPMSLYSFPGNMPVSADSSGNPTAMSSLFCQGPMHPLYMSSHLPFSRSSV